MQSSATNKFPFGSKNNPLNNFKQRPRNQTIDDDQVNFDFQVVPDTDKNGLKINIKEE